MSRPSMHVPKNSAEGDHKLQVLHTPVCIGRPRSVIQHQSHSGHNEDNEQIEADETEPKRIGCF